MGIVKISDLMHENLRIAGNALSRSINAQAEHWMRIGMLSEMYPELDHRDICQMLVPPQVARQASTAERWGAEQRGRRGPRERWGADPVARLDPSCR